MLVVVDPLGGLSEPVLYFAVLLGLIFVVSVGLFGVSIGLSM